MGNFRSDNREDRGFGGRSGGFNRTGFRSRDAGGGGGFRGRDSGGYGRRPLEMHEVTCSKCGKQCEVPFKPTGDKPVFCSDCFRKEGGGGSSSRFSSRDNSSSSGISSTQYTELNTKLDKILGILKKVEFEEVEDEESEEEVEEDKAKKAKK